jgi:hypothetical protein
MSMRRAGVALSDPASELSCSPGMRTCSAAALTAARRVDHEARRLQRDGGVGEHERRRASYLRTGFKGWQFSKAFDPRSGSLANGRDTVERWSPTRCLIPVRLIRSPSRTTCVPWHWPRGIMGEGARSGGRPEWTIVEDHRRSAPRVAGVRHWYRGVVAGDGATS